MGDPVEHEDGSPQPSVRAQAVVLTHRRRRLATDTVHLLVDQEHFTPDAVVLVVNGEGGLDDPGLEAQVDVVRLPTNLGPAGGFHAALDHARRYGTAPWIYTCEDDISLLRVERPVVDKMIARAEAWAADTGRPIGAVVSYGRRIDPRTGRTTAFVTGADDHPLEPVDCAAWGATLVSRAALDAGVLPDPALFFGYEDFDWFLSLGEAGFAVLCDTAVARQAAAQVSDEGRRVQQVDQRPNEAEEPWRQYYIARNFVEIARRHGHRRWIAWHLALSFRRWQLAGFDRGTGRAIGRGLVAGARHRLGPDPRYQREAGER